MDENYYRELIDKVNRNQKKMWGRSEDSDEGFEDFKNLWGILSDEEADVSAETYFEAVDLCMTSFFGSIQDRNIVWENVVNHYQQALKDPDNEKEFRNAFVSFSKTYYPSEESVSIDQFTRMMHMAINAKDLDIVYAVIKCAFCPDIWADENDYPEWSVWYAVFSDKDFSEIPHTSKATETINELYSKLGGDPEMDRLRELYDEYFGN